MNKPKFRAWDTWNKRMITEFGDSNRVKTKDGSNYVDLQSRKDGTVKAVLMEFKNSRIFTRPVEDLPTMQYTGLKDKNGVEIYEGDVVINKEKRVITYGEQRYDGIVSYIGFNIFAKWNEQGGNQVEYEVIGNIHANPELLNEVE